MGRGVSSQQEIRTYVVGGQLWPSFTDGGSCSRDTQDADTGGGEFEWVTKIRTSRRLLLLSSSRVVKICGYNVM